MKPMNVEPEVVSLNDFRYYIINGKAYPSVTSILGAMLDKSWLDKWIENIGKENADRISKFAANRGSVMHQLNEYFLTSKFKTKEEKLRDAQQRIIPFVKENEFTEKEEIAGRKLFYNFYLADSFERIKKVVCAEKALYCTLNGGYAGRTDIIAEDIDDKLFVLDFKSAKKPKDKKQIGGYYLQIAAYYVAYFQMTGVKPSYGEVWISNEFDDEPQLIHLSQETIKKLSKRWLKIVESFHQKFPSPQV